MKVTKYNSHDDPHIYFPYLFMCQNPAWKKLIKRLGYWMLLCPPIGWLMALGYRKVVAVSLYNHTSPLPIPSLNIYADLRLLIQGLGALGVMIFYFTPALICTWTWGKYGDLSHSMQIDFWLDIELLYFLLLSFLLIPMTLGGVVGGYYLFDPSFQLTSSQMIYSSILLLLSVFIIPSGYMQVGRRGYWLDACRIWKSLFWICTHPKIYLYAWWKGLYISLIALSMGLRAPWALAWCYISIVWFFNNPALKETSPYHPHQYPKTLDEFLQQMEVTPQIRYQLNRPIPIWWDE